MRIDRAADPKVGRRAAESGTRLFSRWTRPSWQGDPVFLPGRGWLTTSRSPVTMRRVFVVGFPFNAHEFVAEEAW